ncbi:MAG: phosphoribosylformylglycinamidine synthase subunit PurL [Candidatus Binatia bacterium]
MTPWQHRSASVTEELAGEHGLTPDEYRQIQEHLGRTPTIEELGVFSVMWSEHCSYKSSRSHLRRLPTSGDRVLQGPGENAGAVDIGDGLAAVFKIESHNHPSFVEPYQGAATGVGGILRDVFTMGARPVANMNSLYFGSPQDPRTPYLLSGVVSGIGDYGNCVGVPTIGGQVSFDAGYDANILVNAFSLGVVRTKDLFRAVASGIGNPVLYVGSKTGRDGIHGASLLASAEFSEESQQMKPTVQVGDPFSENLLIEACLEVLKGDDVVAIQDMGAAGLTSSSVEMASRGGVGIELDLDLVPLRDQTTSAYEILLSESQERMLLVTKKSRAEAVASFFARWGLDCIVVGEVTADPCFRARWRGETVADIPVEALTDAAPVYERPLIKASCAGEFFDPVSLADCSDANRDLLDLLSSPNLCSKRWVYEQYDSYVGGNTLVQPGGDAAVVRVRENGSALAMSTDCNSRYVMLDPYLGTQHAVAEAVRNLAAAGAKPLALSDCLNFGNPEKPEVMWQFSRAIDGMADACRHFDIPVISGNVSFYNDTRGRSIPPTPVIAMVGLIEDCKRFASSYIRSQGQTIFLLGEGEPQLRASEFLLSKHGLCGNAPPPLDLDLEKACSALCAELIATAAVGTAHDVSEGGIAVALAEMCLGGDGFGLEAFVPGDRTDATLFGECGGRILVAVDANNRERVVARATEAGVAVLEIGRSGGSRLRLGIGDLGDRNGRYLVDLEIDELRSAAESTLPAIAGLTTGQRAVA